MSWETENPVAVVDVETNPPVIVTRYQETAQAEWFLGYLREHGGQVLREKADRGGYGIDAPEECPCCGHFLAPCAYGESPPGKCPRCGNSAQGKKEGAS